MLLSSGSGASGITCYGIGTCGILPVMSYLPRAPQSRRLFRNGPVVRPGIVLGFVEYSKLFLAFTVLITLACIPHPFGWPLLIGHYWLIWAQQKRGLHMAESGEADRITKPVPVRRPVAVVTARPQGLWMHGDPTRPKLEVDYPLRKAQKVAPIHRPNVTADSSAVAEPGWYPDPSGGPVKRYWDGRAWANEIASW